jgi:hypothetical protein
VSPAAWQSVRLVAGSQGAWFACVLGAANGTPWVGVVVTAAWAAAWVVGRGRRRADLAFLSYVGALGYLVDSIIVSAGAFGFPDAAHLGGPSPLWMVALWVGFGTTLRTLGPLLPLPWAAMALGAVAGPLAYSGGVALGAAHFGADTVTSRVVIGAAWAVAMPLLVALERRVR